MNVEKISISLPKSLLEEIDKRRKTELGEIKRSSYIVDILFKWHQQSNQQSKT